MIGLGLSIFQTAVRRLLGGVSSQPSIYVGQVANNSRVLDTVNNTTVQTNSRTAHIATDSVPRVIVVFPNWRNAGSSAADTNYGYSQTYTASIEYPAGTFTKITWNGATSVTNAPTDDQTVSDWCNVSIPAGATFWLRVHFTTSTGWYALYQEASSPTQHYPTSVASFEYGSSFTDKTMGGTIGQTAVGLAWFPLAILGETRKPSVLIVGSDSIGRGAADSYDPNTFNHGWIEQAIANNFGVINAGSFGDTAVAFATSSNSAKRQALKQYCSHVVSNDGCNDLASKTAAQITTAQTTILGFFSDKRCYRTTITPRSTVLHAVASLSSSGTTVTGTTASPHNLSTGQSVIITGASPSTYNGTFSVTAVDANNFTYTALSAPASSPATGTINFNDQWETSANQVLAASSAVGGAVDTVNASIVAGLPGSLGVFDPYPAAIDRSTNTWKVDGTPYKYTGDGVHPTPFAEALLAQQVAAAVQAINRTGL